MRYLPVKVFSETQNSTIECHGAWDGECVCRCKYADGSVFIAWHGSNTDKTWADVVASATADYLGGFHIFELWQVDMYSKEAQYLAGNM